MHKILSTILEIKKRRIKVLEKNKDALASLVKKAPGVRSFKKAITKKGKIALIAEIKQASPSAGVLRKNFSHLEIARVYKKAKVDAISVVTEEDFFLGKVNYIEEIRKDISLPILRKDFIIDKIQILESRAVGADALLLIMGILSEEKLKILHDYAKELGMDVLVEVHTEKELKKVLNAGIDIIGINNRNLHTLTVSLDISKKLLPFLPKQVIKVSESGINNFKDVLLLKGLGANAMLIGSSFMKAKNIAAKIKELNIDA